MSKIAFVLGTRPEIIKLYSSIQYCVRNKIPFILVNTDQHYDQNMRDVFFDELGLPQPDYKLGVGSGSHAKMLSRMLTALEEVFEKEKPSVVVVQGDTNTVLAGCMVAVKMGGIKVAHVEAGLRSYDRSMPEEYNRIVTDHCSDFLFAPTQKQADILISEAIPKEWVYVTGNTVVDAALELSKTAEFKHDGKFVFMTCHRPSNTDEPKHLEAVLSAVQEACEELDARAVFPVHPRLNAKLDYIKSFDRIEVVEPMPYKQTLAAMRDAEMIFTDSGGIQEESCILQRKCVILRTNTERPETVEVGGAVVLDSVTKEDILAKYHQLKDKKVEWYNPFGDGGAGERIIETLKEKA
jgi:UDP-N-acetylglucosamine 2-epimerase (non-hydrolysing)